MHIQKRSYLSVAGWDGRFPVVGDHKNLCKGRGSRFIGCSFAVQIDIDIIQLIKKRSITDSDSCKQGTVNQLNV